MTGLISALASRLKFSTGAGLVGFSRLSTYVAGTMGWEVKNLRVNVKTFGVKGDGSDEWALIQAVINFIQRGVIEFPCESGEVYGISDELVITGKNSVVLQGRGGKAGSEIRWVGANSGTKAFVRLTNASYCKVVDMQLWSAGATKPAYGVRITSQSATLPGSVTQYNDCENVRVQGVNVTAFAIGDTSNTDQSVDGNRVLNCSTDLVGQSAVSVHGANTNLTVIEGGALQGGDTATIHIGTFARGVKIGNGLMLFDVYNNAQPGLIRIDNKFSGLVEISGLVVELYYHKLLYAENSIATQIGSGQVLIDGLVWTCNFAETGSVEDRIIEYGQHGLLSLKNVYGAGRSDGVNTYILHNTPDIGGPGLRTLHTENVHLYGNGTANMLIACPATANALAPVTWRGNYRQATGPSMSVAPVRHVSVNDLPSFLVYASAGLANVTGNGALYNVPFNTKVRDVGANVNGASQFVAPTTGDYELSATVQLSGLTAAMTLVEIQIITSARSYSKKYSITPAAGGVFSASIDVPCADMAAGNIAYVAVKVSNGAGDTATVLGGATLVTWFSGKQVH